MKIKSAIETNVLTFPFEIKAEDLNEDGVFKGYASVFGNKDSHNDIIMPGAFAKSISVGGRNGTGVAMLYQHDSHRPIGIWTSINEDQKGLRVEGKLALGTQDGREVYELMKMKALQGLSIGYDSIVHERDEKKNVRYLKEVDLWEISPVTFASNKKATIIDVKQIDIEAIKLINNERDLETFLRESGRFSKNAAIHVVSWWKSFRREADNEQKCILAEDEAAIILDSLSQANKSLKEFYEINSIRESFSAFDF